ncbi:MAG: hypothetical protein HQK89_16350 [Nitrospirae bacterium]|nr:hypothetical protein [Nitrospirota bacterium]
MKKGFFFYAGVAGGLLMMLSSAACNEVAPPVATTNTTIIKESTVVAAPVVTDSHTIYYDTFNPDDGELRNLWVNNGKGHWIWQRGWLFKADQRRSKGSQYADLCEDSPDGRRHHRDEGTHGL